MFRIEKDKNHILKEISDVRAATEEVNRSKVHEVCNTMCFCVNPSTYIFIQSVHKQNKSSFLLILAAPIFVFKCVHD